RDWSSDVCSSDLGRVQAILIVAPGPAERAARDQGQAVGDEQPPLAEQVQGVSLLAAVGGQRAPVSADIDVAQGVEVAVAIAEAVEGVGAHSADLPIPVDACEGPAGPALLV